MPNEYTKRNMDTLMTPAIGEKWKCLIPINYRNETIVEITEVGDMFISYKPGLVSETGIMSLDAFRDKSCWVKL